MKKPIFAGTALACGIALLLIVNSTSKSEAQNSQSLPFVRLQATSPGIQQSGNLNLSGVAIAGQFQGDGSLLGNLNASSFALGLLSPAFGGTGIDSSATAAGSLLYTTGVGAWNTLPPGNNSQVLTMAGGVPSWSDQSGFTLPFNGSANVASPGAVFKATNTGTGVGVWGQSDSTSGRGVYGWASANNGNAYGVYGESTSNNGAGVYGISPATSGSTAGGIFKSASTLGVGVFAQVTSLTGGTTAGIFRTESISGLGVLGAASAVSGGASGGEFTTESSGGRGVSGYAFSSTGGTYGVYGQSNSSSGKGVFGWAAAASGSTYGVYGQCQSPSGRAVFGYSAPTGGSGDAVFGQSSGSSGRGTVGYATASTGVSYGMWGQADSQNGRGVYGYAPASVGLTYGVLGQAGVNGWAVFALGDMAATGLKPFRIDLPTDPQNKYLYHYATESPYPQNFYTGNVVTDAKGYALVELPSYFEVVNTNFKYQLTVVDESGEFAQAIVSRKIRGRQFQIRTDRPKVEVSWRVEADRNDPYVRLKNPKDLVDKEGVEKGKYQLPELYGKAASMGMNYDPKLSNMGANGVGRP